MKVDPPAETGGFDLPACGFDRLLLEIESEHPPGDARAFRQKHGVVAVARRGVDREVTLADDLAQDRVSEFGRAGRGHEWGNPSLRMRSPTARSVATSVGWIEPSGRGPVLSRRLALALRAAASFAHASPGVRCCEP